MAQDPISMDIVISGAGVIGTTLAVMLAKSLPQYRICIVEPNTSISTHNSTSHSTSNSVGELKTQQSLERRSFAISQQSKHLLDEYGVWSKLAHQAQPILDIQVSDRGHIGKTYLTSQSCNVTALGYVVTVDHLQRVLVEELRQYPQVNWCCPDQITAIDKQPEILQIRLHSGQLLTTRLLLCADGGQSATRQLLGIDTIDTTYQQLGIIANVSIQSPHQGRAYERFTDQGPIALLPMQGQYYSLVWCHNQATSEHLLALDDQDFVASLQQAFGYRAGVFTGVSSRVAYPLQLSIAERMITHRAILLGNSLHNIHPIAGQGFNLGLRDIAALHQILTTAGDPQQAESRLGEFQQLHRYQKQRQADLTQVVQMTDTLVKLFTASDPLMAVGRNLGLLTMQLIDRIKQPFAQQAMGFNGNRTGR